MKKLLLLILLAVLFTSARADDYGFLAFQTQDGTLQTMTTEGLRITFADGELVATAGTQTLRVPLSDLTKMFFSTDAPTGIESLGVAADIEEGTVYNVQGVRVGRLRQGEKQINGLPQSIYIVKRGGKAEKVSVR